MTRELVEGPAMAEIDHDTDFEALLCQPSIRATAYIGHLRKEKSRLADQLTVARAEREQMSASYQTTQLERDKSLQATQLERDQALQDCQALEREQTQLREKLESVEKQCATHDEVVRRLEQEKRSADADAKSAAEELVVQRQTICDLEQENKELKGAESSSKNTVELKEEANRELCREKTSLETQRDSLSAQVAKLQSDVVHRDEKLSAAQNEHVKLSKQVQSSQAEIEKLESDNRRHNFQRDVVDFQDRRIQELAAELEAHKDGAAEKLRTARDEHDATKLKLANAKDACRNVEAERDTLAAHLGEVQTKQTKLEQDLHDIRSQLHQAQVPHEKAEHQCLNDRRLRRSASIEPLTPTRKDSAHDAMFVQHEGKRPDAAAFGPFSRPEPAEPTGKNCKPWAEFEVGEISFAVGKAPDRGAAARELYSQMGRGEITAYDLRQHCWTLSTVDLSGLPLNAVNENIGYQDLPRKGRASLVQQQTQSAEPPPSTEPPNEEAVIVETAFKDPFVPSADAVCSPVDSTDAVLEPIPTGSRKRARSRSPGPRTKAVCRPCRRRGSFCTSNGACSECVSQGTDCVYRECSDGEQCHDPRCSALHPGQWDSPSGTWSIDSKPKPAIFKQFGNG